MFCQTNNIFWKDGFKGKCSGGYYYRVFDMVKFMKELPGEVVGLRFDENNLEFICDYEEEGEEEGNIDEV